VETLQKQMVKLLITDNLHMFKGNALHGESKKKCLESRFLKISFVLWYIQPRKAQWLNKAPGNSPTFHTSG
jgi:hypothetical protein